MAITPITSITQFTNVSVTESAVSHTISPSFSYAAAGASVIQDISKFDNEVFKFYIRMDDTTSSSFRILLGTDISGNGKAIQFDFTATNKYIRLVNISGIATTYDTIDVTNDVGNRLLFSNNQFIACRVEVVNSKLRFFYGNLKAIDVQNFTNTGTYWGFASLVGTSQIYTSDMFYVYDQILHGNVNLNGAPSNDGTIITYLQATNTVFDYSKSDPDGNYMVFIDDDPINLNKYFMYGFVSSLEQLQPRGVSNISI